jgi:small subunit ribosomal protein S2
MEVSLKTLIEVGAHFGHQSRRWNPKMRKYLYGEKGGVHIFDLTITKRMLEEALDALEKLAASGKKILFLGTKKQAKDAIAKIAEETGQYYVNERWLGGTLTNFETIKRSVDRMKELEAGLRGQAFRDRTKKEKLLLKREFDRLHRFLGGIAGIEEKPGMLFVIDVKKERAAIREAVATGIPVVGIVDSNADPDGVEYPIPMNDDASKAIDYVLGLVKDAITRGAKKQKPVVAKGDK